MVCFKNNNASKPCVKSSLLYVAIAIVVYLLGNNSYFIQQIYLPFYQQILSVVLRKIAAFFTFSIGDVLYFLLGVLALLHGIKYLKKAIQNKIKWSCLIAKYVGSVVKYVSLVFIIFQLFWGFNYSKKNIATDIGIKEEVYCKEQLNELIEKIVDHTNYYRLKISTDTVLPLLSFNEMKFMANEAYSNTSKRYTVFRYKNFCVKPSAYGGLGNYLNFSGYFNPFTGEAQVRTDLPNILQPFIICHEIGHQLGYAAEDEANFSGFLAAMHSNNNYLKYSMYLDLLNYALNDLYYKYAQDGCLPDYAAKLFQIKDCLHPLVKYDRRKIAEYFAQHQKSTTALSNSIYDGYLKLNNQYLGIQSYTQMVSLVMAYGLPSL